MRAAYKFLTLSVCLVILAAAGVYALFYSAEGAEWLSRMAVSRYMHPETQSVEETSGSLSDEVVYHNIEIKDPEGFPSGTVVKVQSLALSLKSLDMNGLYLKIENARVQIPSSDPVVIFGTLKAGTLDFNIYSRRINVADLRDFMPDNKFLRGIGGYAEEVDLFIKGTLQEAALTGSFRVAELTREKVKLLGVPVTVEMTFPQRERRFGYRGRLQLGGGTLQSPHTQVSLTPGRILLDDVSQTVGLDLGGETTVDKVKIKISLKGTLDNPELQLTSDPSLPKEKLLLMLATGRSWSRSEEALLQAKLTPEVTRDFIDYFIFSGKGKKLAEAYGISDVYFRFDEQTKGVGFKKSLTDKAKVGYTVEQTQNGTDPALTTQTVGGDYTLTDQLSVGMERSVSQQGEQKIEDTQPQVDDKVFFKYKMQF